MVSDLVFFAIGLPFIVVRSSVSLNREVHSRSKDTRGTRVRSPLSGLRLRLEPHVGVGIDAARRLVALGARTFAVVLVRFLIAGEAAALTSLGAHLGEAGEAGGQGA
jgi:hypothetical protein